VATLDQVSAGRAGWNAVTGSSDFAAMNFGMPGMPEHDLRYDMADEYMAAIRGLWVRGSRRDHRRSQERHPGRSHQGPWRQLRGQVLQTRGPLNSGRVRRPAGDRAGRRLAARPQFAAAHADTIVVNAKGIDAMRAYRDDVRKHMVAQGRRPDDCKVLFLVNPSWRDHGRGQHRKHKRLPRQGPRARAAGASRQGDHIDFGKFDLDKPLPDDVTTNGHQQNLDQFRTMAAGRSIRHTMASFNAVDLSVELVGTPDTVAARMGEVMQEVGGDGFLFSMPNVNRRTLAEIEDGLVPALQDRGLVRKSYEHAQFRDNLLAF